jgi:hypothetical protein
LILADGVAIPPLTTTDDALCTSDAASVDDYVVVVTK